MERGLPCGWLRQKDPGAHLFADHENRKRARYRGAACSAASARWRWRGRSALITHGEDAVRFAVERYRSGAVHRLEILFNLETRRGILLNNCQCTVAMCAERFHRRRVEHCAVGTAGERQSGEDLTVVGT